MVRKKKQAKYIRKTTRYVFSNNKLHHPDETFGDGGATALSESLKINSTLVALHVNGLHHVGCG